MSEFLNKHTVKFQAGVLLTIIGFIIYWTFIGATYAHQINVNTGRIDRIEVKLDSLATKDDLIILKQDIKDFLR